MLAENEEFLLPDRPAQSGQHGVPGKEARQRGVVAPDDPGRAEVAQLADPAGNLLEQLAQRAGHPSFEARLEKSAELLQVPSVVDRGEEAPFGDLPGAVRSRAREDSPDEGVTSRQVPHP